MSERFHAYEREILLGRVQATSTVDTDVNLGLDRALGELRRQVDVSEADIASALACSSAAGGLRMACIGLVPEYTTEAGRLAALGAGAKVVGETLSRSLLTYYDFYDLRKTLPADAVQQRMER